MATSLDEIGWTDEEFRARHGIKPGKRLERTINGMADAVLEGDLLTTTTRVLRRAAASSDV